MSGSGDRARKRTVAPRRPQKRLAGNTSDDQLKLVQRRLANILYACCDEIDKESDLRSLSHGFRSGHSIVTNAKPHRGRRFVLNLDLKDFFPSFNFGRIDIPFNKSLARRRDNIAGAADGEGPKAKPKTGITSLGPLGGRLAHIHHVKDQIDTRKEVEKRKHKTTFRKLYCRFLFYKTFAALDRRLILTEGKTDNVYLSLAIRYSTKFQPKLGYFTDKGFQSAVSYFNHLNKTREVMELDGGSGNFKFFVMRYKELMESFGHKPQACPVILLLDNDDGAKDIFAVIKQNYGVEINHDGAHGFYHVTHNLYVVKTPHVGKKKTCIEDMFKPSLLKEELGGKKLNLGAPNPATEYGKHVFAEKVVRPKAPTLKWDGFEPLLQRISDVIDHYKAPA